MTPDQYCQEKTAQSGSSFYYSFLFLPPERRLAITALYALCRQLDDAVDEASDASVARIKLAWWRTEIQKLFDGKPDHPVTKALQPHLASCGITQARLVAIVDGMEMDLDQTRYLDYAGLRKYCWHVAGVVGELSAGIFGYSDPATLVYADKLGLAFQLTNIIRDVGDDARKGRIYLPVNELQQFDVKASEILNGKYSDRFTALMQFQCDRARAAYRDALAALPEQDRRPQRPGLMMAAIYYALLDEIEASQFQVLHQRISLTPVRKLWLAWRTYVSGGRFVQRRIGA
ncbi:presqualene diphosphate synthase HpnD [Pigmentiphaga litoralis]|uniref:presqualene diphosphate synthase HpnD n=1 Tax=Pigmentiphaga litoralis TaxID=516702 RepID=UPI003B439D26